MSDDIAAEYYKRHHRGQTGRRRYGFTIAGEERERWFRTRIGQARNLLDIGCRDGTMTSRIAGRSRVTGIDIDDDALAAARDKHGLHTLKVNLNQERLPFEDGNFDVVVAGEVIEHLQFPEVVLGDVHRVLGPGGVFLGSVPNAFRLYNRLQFMIGRDFEQDPTHLHHFSPDSLRMVIGGAGFRDIEIDFIGSRYRRLSPRLMGKDMLWACRK
jgi:2-polyprenyl-3-methyl-5-hydroxy-6-metoxy-1,4-benzoquinol methylase